MVFCYGIITLLLFIAGVFYVTDLKGQLKESRPTKNDGEIVSAAGVTASYSQHVLNFYSAVADAQKLCFCLRTS